MATIKGTDKDDSWLVVNPGTFVIDGLGGIDTLNLGTSLRREYQISKNADGTIQVDTVSGASSQFHATLINVERLAFNNGRDIIDLTTYFADTIGPSVITFSPVDQASNVAVNRDLVLTFNEPIVKGAGTIQLKTSEGVVVETFDVQTSAQLSIASNVLTVNPTVNLQYGKNYVLQMSAGLFKDSSGNASSALTSYSFKTAIGEFINGTSGNDVLTSSVGSDTISGNAGNDTVVYAEKLNGFKLSRVGDTLTVVSKSGSIATDTLNSIENLQFSDMTVNLQIQALTKSAPAADVQRLIELYVAFFNRVPDADGLAYWTSEMLNGQKLNTIAETFYNAGVQFSDYTGFSATMSNTDFINVIYRNVLGRSDGADADGLSYWNGELSSGKANRGSLVSTILDAAHGFKGNTTWGWVADLLDNKIAVAKTFAIDWGLGYASSDQAITQGMKIAAAVTPTDTQVAISLIGIAATDMHLT
ncbi:Ig-like domain-containing protein [Undibacterium fentianense]|uniref:Ig-like domain-containing protein n=1 Tax=Undibacterium fentianense TaxID=2828728 RepID=A0A941E3Z6_9BURK|nr:Ig-like domain-containing protein [Undibacterium fentianense]MBR7799303.1 Ig-like domain-containing protein [Undibacterium fentianense]